MKYKLLMIIAGLLMSGFAYRYTGSDNEKEATNNFVNLLARKAVVRDSIVFKQYRVFVAEAGNKFYPGFEEFKPILNKELVRAQDEYDRLYISYLKYRLDRFNSKLKDNYGKEFSRIYKSDNYVNIEHSGLTEIEGIRANAIIIDYMDSIVNIERHIRFITLKNKKLKTAYKKENGQ